MTEIVEDTPTTGQKFAAEVLGTFVLVFFGVGAAVMSGGDYVATGLSFGLTVVVMAYAVGRVSGGHFNPAVTVGAALGGRLPWSATPIYVGAQLVGALLAGAVLFGLLHGRRYTFQWTPFLALPYFTEGVVRAWAEPPPVRILAAVEIALSVALFCCTVFGARALPKPA